MAGEQTVDALLDSLTKLKEQLGTLRLDRDVMRNALAGGAPVSGGNSLALLESLVAIREGTSQKAIIDIMLREIAKQCRGCGMVLLGAGTASFWLGPGFGLAESEKAGTQKMPVSVQEDSLVRRAAATGDAMLSAWPATDTEEDIYRTIGVSEPSHLALIPMTINGRVQAVIFADVKTGHLTDPPALAIIVATAATTIEHLPFRDRIGYSRFPRIEGAASFTQEMPDAAAKPVTEKPVQKAAPRIERPQPVEKPKQPPVVEQAAAVDTETIESYSKELEEELGSSEEVAGVIETGPEPLKETATLEDAEFEIEVSDSDVSEVLAGAEEDDEEVESLDTDEIDLEGSGMEIDFLDSPEPTDAVPQGISSGPMIEAARAHPEVEISEEVEETPAEPEEEPEEEFVPEPEEAAPQEPEKAPAQPAAVNYDAFGLSGYDLDKYDGDLRKKHEKAIRFARLLVSEIKLYNEGAVKLGRENSDLLSRLKDDITRSEALYKQRITSEIRDDSNYFYDEMVRQLAEGNESLLGE